MAPKASQSLSSFKYGAPLYGVAFPEGNTFYVCGGGGSSATGIKNRVVLARCLDGKLTDQIGEYNFGADCPMRMAVTPDDTALVVAMANGGLQQLEIQTPSGGPTTVTPATGEARARISSIQGEVRCMAFSPSGRHLALGFTYGALQVLSWPSLEVCFELSGEASLCDGVRDVDLSPSPSTLVTAVLDNGSCELWNWQTKSLTCRAGLAKGSFKSSRVMMMRGPNHTASHVLPKGLEGISFTKLRFAPTAPPGLSGALNATNPTASSSVTQPTAHSSSSQGPGTASSSCGACCMYALMNSRAGSHLVQWSLHPESKMLVLGRHRRLEDTPGACLELSRDGRLAAVGTSEGSALVLDASSMAIIRAVPGAHMVFSTGICFSADGRQVMSISADASAVAIPTTPPPRSMLNIKVLLLLVVALALLLSALLLLTAQQTPVWRGVLSWDNSSSRGSKAGMYLRAGPRVHDSIEL
mmetsp:Transcript_22716/g.62717  ORF Transcript_22716/g.62717 Transcript_22716/m.62717 type:complete len:470 (+) Transcript_22716:198-1607(+)|eukprot:CAMPEP_0202341374 /NCGR_PEP_ID=MMETSP1126-20121109/2401_1 /ASSEMBLY_ACC=CAM_ASM_000457 /TAXON_ID=3047 /ORGANISM="Dunaliella tertiolecta, Strain CCMP1320" /LENGTH=469 /DNA_ID=CAMNT_0048932191 /DNA_START=133 /DNA_END=1542 /DNA_ORIENTATION=-